MRLATALTAALLANVAHAGTADVETLLAKMRNAYRALHSAKFTVQTAQGGQSIQLSCLFASPRKFRASYAVSAASAPSAKVTLVYDGKTISIQAGTRNVKRPYAEGVMMGALPANLETVCFYDWDTQLNTAPKKNMAQSTLTIQHQDWNGKHWIVLQEWAPSQQLMCHYFIDPKSMLIWRTTIRRAKTNADSVDAQIKTLTLNPPHPRRRLRHALLPPRRPRDDQDPLAKPSSCAGVQDNARILAG